MAILRMLANSRLTRNHNIFIRLMSVKTDAANRDEEGLRKENWKKRCELATAYRALEKYGMGEGVCNHLTAKAPSLYQKDPVILIIPHGVYWSDVTPECLVGINIETADVVEGIGKPEATAHSIHRGIYQYRPEVNSIMHCHPKYSTILSTLQDPELKMIHQNCARFYERIAYDTDYQGIAIDGENTESDRLGLAMKDQSKNILVMGNHGITSVGKTIALAFDRLYYFEKAAQNLILAYQTGQPLRNLAETSILCARNIIERGENVYAEAHFYGIQRTLMKQDRSFINEQ